MGLTVHYNWQDRSVSSFQGAVKRIKKFHSLVKDFGSHHSFEVGDVKELRSQAEIEDHFLPCHYVSVIPGQEYPQLSVYPAEAVYFTVYLGDGCETCSFGLVRYPETVTYQGRKIDVNCPGWVWRDFCKTQYASNPQYGGVQNFLRCHLGLIAILDMAQKFGFEMEVYDEGGYWENRSVEKLLRELADYNQLVAAIAGKIKDQIDKNTTLIASIFDYPNFEHLEAKGEKHVFQTGDEE